MGKDQDKWFERLRNMAQNVVEKQTIEIEKLNSEQVEKLIMDIQTYQVELEIQNEELRHSQAELKESRDRFSTLFEMAPVGYVVLDRSGFVLDANTTILKMLGIKREKFVNQPFSRFIHAEDQNIYFARFNAIYKNPKDKILELKLNGPDHSLLFARIEGRFMEFADSSSKKVTEQLFLNVTDISESKKAEMELKKSEEDHRNFLNALNDAVICSDLDGRVVFINSYAEKLFGCRADNVLGKEISIFCPEDLLDEQKNMIQEVIRNGTIKPFRTKRIKLDGSIVPVEISLHLSLDAQGRPEGFNGVLRDITDRIRQEETIRKTQEKMQYILDSLPDMIIEVDADMRVLWANKSALDLNPDAVGRFCHEAFPGNKERCQGCYCAKAFKSQSIEHGIMHQPSSKTAGNSYWENYGIPLKNRNGDDKELTVLEVSRNVTARVEAEKEKERLIKELKDALERVNELSGLLPICSHCKKIRDDKGYWNQLEMYLSVHSELKFTHSICQECAKKYYPDMDIYEE